MPWTAEVPHNRRGQSRLGHVAAEANARRTSTAEGSHATTAARTTVRHACVLAPLLWPASASARAFTASCANGARPERSSARPT
eukprot:14648120-Alexandrium_andersonii.AAC.1